MHEFLLLKVLPDDRSRHFNNISIFHRCRHVDLFIVLASAAILDQFSQHPSQRFTRSGLGYHSSALDDAPQTGDGADLLSDELVDGLEELWWWIGG